MSQRSVIYVRVSSAEQVEGYSLDVQERDCRAWSERNGVEVDRVFREEGESAKNADRTEFQKMYAYISKNRSTLTYVVVDRLVRFSRNVGDSAIYRAKLVQWGQKLRSVKEQIDETPAGNLQVNVIQAVAQFDNDMRRIHTGNGMKEALEAGRWTFPPPIGYRPGHKGKLTHDPERAPLIAGLYEKVADGHSLSDAVEWAKLHGLVGRRGGVLTDSTASKVLRNPLYKGWVDAPDFGVSRQADFAPIVSAELWARVQRVLNGNSESLTVPHTKVNEAYPLRGVIVCGTCGKLATASSSRGKAGNKFPYYHCVHGRGHLRIPVRRAEAQFVTVLEKLVPNESRMRVVEECFRDAWSIKNASADADIERLNGQLRSLKQRKTGLLAKMETLTDDDFRAMYVAVNSEIERAELALAEAQMESTGWEPSAPELEQGLGRMPSQRVKVKLDVDTALGYLRHLLWNSGIYYSQSDLAGKRRIALRIFTNGIKCSKDGFGTPVTNSLFNMLGDESVDAERLVALPGIEPGF